MRISDWSSDVCSSDLDGPRRHEHPLGRGNPGDLRLDELTRHESPCPVLQRCADIDGPGIGMDAGIDECYRRPSEFDLTVIGHQRSEEHTSELQSLMRNSYAVICLKKKKLSENITEENLE